MMTYRKTAPFLMLAISQLYGCADWQTTPTTVDEHHGMAVRQMIQSQTLYPEHSQEFRQDLFLDGQKGEGIINPYRAPATDLREGKEQVEMDVKESN